MIKDDHIRILVFRENVAPVHDAASSSSTFGGPLFNPDAQVIQHEETLRSFGVFLPTNCVEFVCLDSRLIADEL